MDSVPQLVHEDAVSGPSCLDHNEIHDHEASSVVGDAGDMSTESESEHDDVAAMDGVWVCMCLCLLVPWNCNDVYHLCVFALPSINICCTWLAFAGGSLCNKGGQPEPLSWLLGKGHVHVPPPEDLWVGMVFELSLIHI